MTHSHLHVPDHRDVTGFLLQRTVETPTGRKRSAHLQIDAADIVGIAVLLLTAGSVYVACLTANALVRGKIMEKPAEWIIGACVGLPALSGVGAKLLGKLKKKTSSKP